MQSRKGGKISTDTKSQEKLRSGLTWRSLVAVIFAIVAFVPVSTYMQLLVGTGLGGIASMFVTLLVAEILRLTYARLSKQETLILYFGSFLGGGGGLYGVFFTMFLYTSYFIHSPFAWAAELDGVPLALYVPGWFCPPYGSPAYQVRSLFQPAWLLPIGVTSLMVGLATIADLALSMLMTRIYVEEEQFAFPLADVDVSLVNVISERSPAKAGLFLVSMIPGLVWGGIAYVGPTVLGIQVIPIPFIDFTWMTRQFLPGASFGIATIISAYAGGLMIPFNVVVCMLIPSLVLYLLFQSLLATTFPGVFPEWTQEYFPGMGLINIQNRAFIRVWFVLQIGFGIGASIFMIFKVRKAMASIFRALISRGKRIESILGFPSDLKLLAIYFSCGAGMVAVFYLLIPELPIWVPILAWPIYGFLSAVMQTAMVGEAGYGSAQIPFMWQTLVYYTPYKGYAGFAGQMVGLGAGAGFAQNTKVALATKTKPIDLVKLNLIGSVAIVIMTLISLEIFYRIAPIPSSAYPSTLVSLPGTAQIDVVTVTRQLRITTEYIFGSMGISLAIASIGEALSRFGVPFSAPGFFAGLYMYPTAAIPLFITSALSRFVMPRFFGGRERWRETRGTVVAAIGLGEGLVLIVLTAMALMAKSAWIWDW